MSNLSFLEFYTVRAFLILLFAGSSDGLFRKLLIIPFDEIVVHFFPNSSGLDGGVDGIEGSQAVGFSFESNLGTPLSAFCHLVNAGVSAFIVFRQFLFGFQCGNGGTVDQLEIVKNDRFLQAAAASGFTGLQKRLSYNRLTAAFAPAAPAVHSCSFAGIFGNRQHTELLAHKFF